MSENKINYSDLSEKERFDRNLRFNCLELVRQNGTVGLNMYVNEADKLFQYVTNGKQEEGSKL